MSIKKAVIICYFSDFRQQTFVIQSLIESKLRRHMKDIIKDIMKTYEGYTCFLFSASNFFWQLIVINKSQLKKTVQF